MELLGLVVEPVSLVFFLTWVLGGIFVELILLKIIEWIFSHTPTIIDDVAIKSTRYLIILTFFFIGLSNLEFSSSSAYWQNFIYFFNDERNLIALITLFLTIFLLRFANHYFNEVDKRTDEVKSTILKNTIFIIIFIIGLLSILQNYGISITPILTALGVGGIAVALALQETLSSFISGVNIIATNKIKIGDYISLETGEEGFVTDITWRNTTIRQLTNSYLIVPNQKLGQGIVTNYNRPQKEMSILIDVRVAYDSDLEHVEKITIDVGRKIMKKIEGGVDGFEPLVRFHTFGESSINFTVILRVKEFVNQYLIKHEFIKALKKEYQKTGITIPFPMQKVIIKNGE